MDSNSIKGDDQHVVVDSLNLESNQKPKNSSKKMGYNLLTIFLAFVVGMAVGMGTTGLVGFLAPTPVHDLAKFSGPGSKC